MVFDFVVVVNGEVIQYCSHHRSLACRQLVDCLEEESWEEQRLDLVLEGCMLPHHNFHRSWVYYQQELSSEMGCYVYQLVLVVNLLLVDCLMVQDELAHNHLVDYYCWEELLVRHFEGVYWFLKVVLELMEAVVEG